MYGPFLHMEDGGGGDDEQKLNGGILVLTCQRHCIAKLTLYVRQYHVVMGYM